MNKVWQPATLQSLKAHDQVVPFLKPPISHCLKLGGHGVGRSFRPQNSHSKIASLQGKSLKSRVFLQGTVVVCQKIKVKLSLIHFESYSTLIWALKRRVTWHSTSSDIKSMIGQIWQFSFHSICHRMKTFMNYTSNSS